jgi:ribosomal protein S14
MLKLNTYKKGYRKLLIFNRRSFVVRSFIFTVVQRTFVFDRFFNSCRRVSLLFVWSHYAFRYNFLRVRALKSQCLASWRTGSVFGFFRLTRLELRERAHLGFLRGLRKSSW